MSQKESKPGISEPDASAKLANLPEKMEELMQYSTSCECGRNHSVDLVHCFVQRDALDYLIPIVEEIGRKLNVLVVVDRNTQSLAGEHIVRVMKHASHRVSICTLPDGLGNRPHADETNLKGVLTCMASADIAIAVGSGTINDLTKLASFKCGIPYISVATAPSMNGYTSAISAITVKGVKRTIECHQPYAVIADLGIITKAPLYLIAAGVGDLESKTTSIADFRLSGRLRHTYYCKAPESVVLTAEQRVKAAAEGIPHADPESIAALMEALILSGISMKLAGSSSPASGGEHLISHHWDMTAAEEHRIEGWHGAQVGVCTIVTAALYERLKAISPSSIDIERIIATRPSQTEILKQLLHRHGSRTDEVSSEYFQKYLSDDDLQKELVDIKSNWEAIWQMLDDILRPASFIRHILKKAGAPTTVQQLGLYPYHLTRSFIAARDIRNRFTVLDLAADLDVLERLQGEVTVEAIE